MTGILNTVHVRVFRPIQIFQESMCVCRTSASGSVSDTGAFDFQPRRSTASQNARIDSL